MTILCLKKVSYLAVAASLTFGIAVYSSSASAACATWGCGETHVSIFATFDQVTGRSKDIKTDGYCVYQRLRKFGQSWPASTISGSRACTSAWKNYSTNVFFPYTSGIRLYRDDGRYMTLWGG